MSQFENSEIMIKYADLMTKQSAPPALKPGAPKKVLTPEPIPMSGTGGGGASSSAAGTSAWGGAAEMAGTVVAFELASKAAGALFGGSALATAAGGVTLATAAPWVAGALVLSGSAYAVYQWIEQTDNNVADLISRIEDLDVPPDAQPTVATWVETLNNLRQTFAIPMSSGDPKERLEVLGNKIIAFEGGLMSIKDISRTYNTHVKPVLKDWFGEMGDKGDFERALSKTLANYNKRVNAMISEFKQLNTDISDPRATLKEIRELDANITSIFAAPVYDNQERLAIAWAEEGGRTGSTQLIRKYTAAILRLKSDLKNKILPAAKKRSKKASATPALSKRAVTLPEAPTAAPGKAPKPTTTKKRRLPKSDTVQTMQEQVNDLSTALNVSIGARLVEDGIYGPATAAALVALVNEFSKMDTKKFPAQANLALNLKSKGISLQQINDYKLMVSTPRYVNRVTNGIGEVWNYHMASPAQKQQLSQRDVAPGATPAAAPGQDINQVYTGPAKCDWGAINPSREQKLQCFKTLEETIGGQRVYLYDYARENLSMTDNDIMNMLDRLFGNASPKRWSRGRILDALGYKYGVL